MSATEPAKMPSKGDIRHFYGKDQRGDSEDGRLFELYVLGRRDGYEIAVKDRDGEWETATVTDSWEPNRRFYQTSVAASTSDWPTNL